MKKKFNVKKLTLNKKTISNLSRAELELLNGGQAPITPTTTLNTSESMYFSCKRYYTECLLSACK